MNCIVSIHSFSVSNVDFVPLSENISFKEGDNRKCGVIYTISDEECEYSVCKYEHFLTYLKTSYHRVNLEPSQATIFIEEDLITQNCSELNKFIQCIYTSGKIISLK